MKRLGSIVIGFAILVACSSDDASSPAPAAGSSSSSSSASSTSSSSSSGTVVTDAGGNAEAGGTFAVTTAAYTEGATIPDKYKCKTDGGESVNPPLAWTGAPANTQSFAIVMRDLDAGVIHWVIWDIPAAVTSLPEGVEATATPAAPKGAKQAKFNGTVVGYYGPCSPTKVNTYEITLYAMPTATLAGIDPTTAKDKAQDAIVKAAIASAKISGES